jgi:O-antigen ligase
VFGAIWDFGAAATSSAMFWLSAQMACAGVALIISTDDPPLYRGRWLACMVVAFGLLTAWSALPLAHPILSADGERVSPLDTYGLGVELAKLAGFGALFLCGYIQGSNRAAGKTLFTLLLRFGGIYAIWAILAFSAHPEFVHGLPKQLHLDRLTGSFFSANTAGALFGALACGGGIRVLRDARYLIVDLVERGRAPTTVWLPILIDGLAVIGLWSALLLTLSRTAIMASTVVLIVFGALEAWTAVRSLSRGVSRSRLMLAAAIAGGVVIASVASARLVEKFAALQTDISSRLDIAATFVPLLPHVPIFGYGLGGFATLNGHAITAETAPALWNLGAAHNIALQWWLEAGLAGLLLGVIVIGLIVGRLVWRYSRKDSQRWRGGVALAMVLVLLLHSLADFPLQIDGIAALCALVMGLGCATPAEAQRPQRAKVIA